MFKRMVCTLVVVILAVLAPQVLSAGSSTGVSDVGTPLRIEFFYGAGGLVNNIQVSYHSIGDGREVTMVCRRPNLGPCVQVSEAPTACWQYVGLLQPTCYYSYDTVCGEAQISTVNKLGNLPCS